MRGTQQLARVAAAFGRQQRSRSPRACLTRASDRRYFISVWNFVDGHQDKILNNTCAIWQSGENGNPKDADMVMTQNDNGSCDADRSAPIFHDNRYYTTHGNASVNCGGDFGTTIAAMQQKFAGFEARSTWHTLPDADTVIQWGRDVLGMD